MPATTRSPFMLPYLLDSDPVSMVSANTQALAERLTEMFPDGELPDPPVVAPAIPDSVRIARTSTQSIANATDVTVVWQTAEWDSRPGGAAQWDSTGITVRRDGIYHLTAIWPWLANGQGRRNMKILLNGTTPNTYAIVGDAILASPWENITSVSDQIRLYNGDKLRMVVAQDSGGTLSGGYGASAAVSITGSMSLTWLRPAV
ncbi:MAG: hypothetical protein WBA38_11915 [Gordonia sp. (in: high G+C Gram-positive bacteria)]|uniref:hypothetical protein n=1 Tax=Gordonia sp. (in: high G+C Gram-positive bacteria) TaxID=84139 RepID=UPI003C748AB4